MKYTKISAIGGSGLDQQDYVKMSSHPNSKSENRNAKFQNSKFKFSKPLPRFWFRIWGLGFGISAPLKTLILLIFLASTGFAKTSIPEWARGAVWYHVVPERFRNFNPDNDPLRERVVGERYKDWQVHPWASDWYKLQVWEEGQKSDFYELVADRRYGGDLLGVAEKLTYLKRLGVDVILLSPVFESPSVLKHGASTFHHIDNNFGLDREADWKANRSEREDPKTWTLTTADKAFVDLVAQAHEVEMRVVIEAEFGYCSRDFWAFRDLQENQRESAYKDWFAVTSWDDPATPDTVEFAYESWQDDRNLPLFKREGKGFSEPVKKYFFDVTRRWMAPVVEGESADGVDGWYINNAGATPPEFWHEWRQLVKSVRQECVTVADHWPGLTNGDAWAFDLTANRKLPEVARDFFINSNPDVAASTFLAQLQQSRDQFQQGVTQCLLNSLVDHGSARLSTMIKNPGVACNNHDSGNGYLVDPRRPTEEQVQTQKLLALFQMTYVGAPVIFYGEESGMWGGHSPDNLKPMLWNGLVYEKETYRTIRPDLQDQSANVFNQELFDFYAKLGEIRHENPALRKGDLLPIVVSDENTVISYVRRYSGNEAIILLNTGAEDRTVKFETIWTGKSKIRDLLDDQKFKLEDGKIEVELEKKWGAILVKDK